MPKVFYGSRTRSVTPPSAYASDDSGSEASTDIEVSRRRPAHRRGESIDAAQPDPKRARTRTARDAQGRRALQKACQRNDVERVRAALAQHVDIEDRDYAGTTALHDAALNGNAEIVGLLLQSGAVVDVRSGLEELDTPLMDAVAAGSVEVTRLLLEAGADPRISNAVGKTAVDFLDEEDESATQIVRLLDGATRALRAAGAPVVDAPTHARAPPNLFPPGYEARKRAVSTNFIDVTRRTGRGIRTDAVAHAAEGNLAFVGLALERGWSPSPEALVKAAKFGHQEVVGLLLAFGLDADATFEGQTALKAAVLRGHVATAQLLVQSGSNLDRRDSRGRSYRDLVADLPPTDPMRMLIEGSKPGGAPEGSKPGGAPESSNAGAGVETAAPEPEAKPKVAAAAEPTAGSDSSARVSRDTAPATAKGDAHPRKQSVSGGQRVAAPEAQASVKSERASGEKRERVVSDGSRHKSDRSGSTHWSSASPSTEHASSSATPSGPSDARTPQQRVSSRSESRPEAFRLADLRAIKPKKRSKSTVESDLVKTKDSTPPPPITGPHNAAPSAASGLVAETAPEAASSAPRDAAPEPVSEAVAGSSSPAASASPAAPRDSPALSPLTDAPPEKPRRSVDDLKRAADESKRPVEESPKWIERSNELAELARRREKQRLAREARMLESLANEERRRSQEPHSPAAQSPLSEASSDHVLEAAPASTQSAPAILTESDAAKPVTSAAPASEARAPEPVYASVKHLPFFLRQLSYKDERQNVGPLFVHFIGTTPYYLDVQLAAHAGIPQLHSQYPQWPKVLVAAAHKPTLWTFCRPWAVERSASKAVLAAEEAAFTSLALAWVPKSIVDETLFHGSTPRTVKIRLDPPKPAPKWSALISESELPLRLQLRAMLLRHSPEW